jgi:predicted dehydrogenase
VILQFETDRGAVGSAVISQISAGRKNMLALEIDGANEALAFNQEGPEELWVGRRENATVIKRDPGALSAPAARMATLPAGHPQGYHDCFDAFVADAYAAAVTGEVPEGMPGFRDGLRAARITAAVLASARTETWVDVPDAAALTAGSVDV